MTTQRRAQIISDRLKQLYPVVKTPLNHTNSYELLFATILSAQCTDARVNIVTKILFKRYPELQDYANADLDELKAIIRPTGFYNNKAKNIQNAARKIINNFNGHVPDNMEDLLTLPGVARKTANVILARWFHKQQGIAVDTHVIRLSQRLGLSKHHEPEKIEQDLMKLFPQDEWGDTGLRIIFHGRNICHARNPECENCILNDICPSAFKFPRFQIKA